MSVHKIVFQQAHATVVKWIFRADFRALFQDLEIRLEWTYFWKRHTDRRAWYRF